MSIYVYALIPVIGYVGLWLLGSLFFLIYFKICKVPVRSDYTAMIQKIPPIIAIVTVPACSFISFFITTGIVLGWHTLSQNMLNLLLIGVISLVVTICLDLLITVRMEKVRIRTYPINLMYLFAWLVIIPAIILAGLA